MARRGLPLADLVSLADVFRRTALLRFALVLALVAALAAEASLARGRGVREAVLIPPGTNGVLVLDASKSVVANARIALLLQRLRPNPYRRIEAVLRQLARGGEPVGLVVFSDLAYEMLPPGTPAHALEPLVRFFSPKPDVENALAEDPFIPNPWDASFSGGTQISGALLAALDSLRRNGVERPSILLVSDLEAPGDERRLTEALLQIREEGVELRIVSLAAVDTRQELYAGILGDGVFVEPAELDAMVGRRFETRFEGVSPGPLVLAGGLVLLLVGAHERLLVRLPLPAWRRRG